MLETAVNSFVLRFVQESNSGADLAGTSGSAAAGADAEWHGFIRHVQSNTELRFVQMDEALAFIASFVPLQPGGPVTGAAGEGR